MKKNYIQPSTMVVKIENAILAESTVLDYSNSSVDAGNARSKGRYNSSFDFDYEEEEVEE